MIDTGDRQPGGSVLNVLACLVIITAGLKLAGPIVVPIVLAAFLAVVTMPVLFRLRARGVPGPLAIGMAMLLDALVLVAIVLLVTNSVGGLNERLPEYTRLLQERFVGWVAVLEARGLSVGEYVQLDLLEPSRVLSLFTGTVRVVLSLLSMALLVGLIMVFVLAESTVLPVKFKAVFGSSERADFDLRHMVRDIQAYVWIKTLVSVGTGVSIGLLCWLLGVDFPILLGLVAFILNFVPQIGSLIAAVPALLITFITLGEVRVLAVALGYMAVNALFGNLLEPQLFGRRMGLSVLVVFLSLLFWAWVWGPWARCWRSRLRWSSRSRWSTYPTSAGSPPSWTGIRRPRGRLWPRTEQGRASGGGRRAISTGASPGTATRAGRAAHARRRRGRQKGRVRRAVPGEPGPATHRGLAGGWRLVRRSARRSLPRALWARPPGRTRPGLPRRGS